MSDHDHLSGSWVGYAAALWALIFAAFHIVWATGWYIGLEEEPASTAFAKRWVLVYDLVVAGMCVVAVPVALALVQPWGRRLPRSLIGALAWTGTGLLVVRAGGSLVQLLYMVATGTFVPRPRDLWEVWFYLGAVLFSISTWRFWRVRKRAPAAA
jgi:hypothetical protein